MATKLNSEFNYRYQVQGETIWEKIKTLKGFLEGRIRAQGLEEVGNLKRDAKIAEVEYLEAYIEDSSTSALDKLRVKPKLLELRAEVLEIAGMQIAADEAYLLNKQEVKIIEKLLAEAYEEAEPSRIEGYSDEDMFEANAANEFTVMIGKEIQAEIIANGRPSPAKLRNAMSNPITFIALQQAGLIPEDARMLIGSNDPRIIQLSPLNISGQITQG